MSEENGIIGIKFGNNTFNFSGSIGEKGEKGDKGDPGENGTSITIKSIVESEEDGGENVVTFSDESTLTIKNGKTGAQGPQGPAGSGEGTDLSNYYTIDETNNAISTAINNVAGIKIASGSYNSDDWEFEDEDYINGTLTINIGFRPKKVEFQYQNGGGGLVYYTYLFNYNIFELTDTGFKVTKDLNYSTAEGLYPDWTEVTNVYWVAIG